MDADFWTARVHSAKSIAAVHPTRFSSSGNHGAAAVDEGEDEVCPICAANLGKDPLGHFTVQHMHSIKRRKESQKSGFWNNVSMSIVKDFRELSSFLGTSSGTSSGEPADDPLLSPFICNVPLSVSEDSQKNAPHCVAASCDGPSINRALPNEANELNYEEKNFRATFIQELLASIVL